MSQKFAVTLIPGDGIGPEISQSVKQIFAAAKLPIEFHEVGAGLECFEKTGELLPAATVNSIRKNRLALKGPTTTPLGQGHRSINVLIRQMFNLHANIRPIDSFIGVKSLYQNLSFVIVRENTEDLYKGIEYKLDEDTAHGLKIITKGACKKISEAAFQLAIAQGRKSVTAVHKANIMKLTDGLFLSTFYEVAKNYPHIVAKDMIIDNCCMQLVTNPHQFEVIVTENLYGDILSDLASGLVGGLGLAAGANVGDDIAVFEAVHGSAPDIAGRNIANPTAFIKSSILMLSHMGLGREAKILDQALLEVFKKGQHLTGDLGGSASTSQFTDEIIKHLGKL